MAQNVDISKGQLPLRGVVLCCTALSQDARTKLPEVAIQMGAVHKLDLTSDVTHLVVGSTTTPKYRYVAKDRPDIKVLSPSWIDAVRECWMEGGDVDVSALEKEHGYPPFTGLEMCVTGFDDLEQRNFLAATIEEQGGIYHGDLTKIVTHLIAAAPQGAKYAAARQWGTKIVSYKWFEDSLHRGMALDESLYDPIVPDEQQGIGAFRLHVETKPVLGKHKRPDEAAGGDINRKRLRRTASTRLESQSQDMWQDMSARSVSLDYFEADQWNEDDGPATLRVAETRDEHPITEDPMNRRRASGLPSETSEVPTSLFTGIYVFIHGFATSRSALLGKYLEPNGAQVVNSVTELEEASSNALFKDRYLLVPHAKPDKTFTLPQVPAGTITTTEWWVERCIHHKHLLNPGEDVLSSPLWDVKLPAFSDLLVSTTGFVGVDLRQVAEAVKLMGASYQEKVVPSSSVLVSGASLVKKEKAFYAKKHSIPVVSADWLWSCLRSKKKVPFERFKVHLPALDSKDFGSEPSTSSPASGMTPATDPSASKSKDSRHPKRLSNTRSKHAMPSLHLQAVKGAPANKAARPQPIVHEDDDDSPLMEAEQASASATTALPHRASQPLQEMSPNSSPRKTSNVSKDDDYPEPSNLDGQEDSRSRTMSPVKPASPPKSSPNRTQPLNDTTEAPPPARLQHELTADLAEILLNKSNASRPSSAAGSGPPPKRKNRPLGRAPSGILNRSASFQSDRFSPALSLDDPESAADGFGVAQDARAPPGTQLGYGTPEAEAHSLQMSKRMGTKLQDDSGVKRLASLGTVKDSALIAEAKVGNRARGRYKTK